VCKKIVKSTTVIQKNFLLGKLTLGKRKKIPRKTKKLGLDQDSLEISFEENYTRLQKNKLN